MVPKLENPYTSDEPFIPADNAASFERAPMEEQAQDQRLPLRQFCLDQLPTITLR